MNSYFKYDYECDYLFIFRFEINNLLHTVSGK